jgi:hypothetical protein
MSHPARTMPFAELWAGLQAARAAGMVIMRLDADTGRSVWCYTPSYAMTRVADEL